MLLTEHFCLRKTDDKTLCSCAERCHLTLVRAAQALEGLSILEIIVV